MTTNDTTLEGILKEFEDADFRIPDEAAARAIADFGDESLHLELIDWKKLKSFISHACEKVRQAEREEVGKILLELIDKQEQVNGFQPYHICSKSCGEPCWLLMQEKKAFFDGFVDGRNLYRIDLKFALSSLTKK